MTRISIFLLSLWLAVSPVLADGLSAPGIPPIGPSSAAFSFPPSSGAAYQGPGDIVSGAKAWWGLRCYNEAYSGNVADITDSATGNTLGTRLQCSSGTVVPLVSASGCTFVTGNACSTLATTCATACNVVNLYDQSGALFCSGVACNLTQATNADRPTVNTSCVNSHPCLAFSGATQFLADATAMASSALSQTLTIYSVSTRTGTFTTRNRIFATASPGNSFLYDSTANTGAAFMGTTFADFTVSDSHYHSIIFVASAASSTYCVDGCSGSPATVSTSPGTTGFGGAFTFGASAAGATPLTGNILELGLWASGFSSANQSAVASNITGYWGALP